MAKKSDVITQIGCVRMCCMGQNKQGTSKDVNWHPKLSSKWRSQLNKRINSLQQLRDQLTGCIGCGCFSLKRCELLNKGDCMAETGTGHKIFA